MAQVTTAPAARSESGFGATQRKDAWWFGPLATLLGLLAFLVYANVVVFFVPGYFEIRQDRSDFFKPANPVAVTALAQSGESEERSFAASAARLVSTAAIGLKWTQP